MRTCCYVRTSTLDQAREEKVSIPDQINWAKKFTLEKGWEWIGEYVEPGVTGDTEIDDRLALSKLINDAKHNKFDLVLVYHSSRLAREPDIGMKVCRILGQIKKQVYFRNAPIEPVIPDKFAWGVNVGSQYMMAFSFIGDFQENVARSERVRSGFRGLAEKGILTFAPLGYKKIRQFTTDSYGRQKYVWSFDIDPITSLIVKKIFSDYVDYSYSLRKIALELNSKMTPSPSGKISKEAWSSATIKNILTNPTYIGKVRWGKKLGSKYLQGKSNTGKQKRIYTKPDQWILAKGSHPALISEPVFYKANEILAQRYKFKGRAIASKGIYTGLVICGRCKRKAFFKHIDANLLVKKYERNEYLCPSHTLYKTCKKHVISHNKLNLLVIDQLEKIASNKKYLDTLLNQNKQDKKTFNESNLLSFEKELVQLNTKQQRLLIAYENNILSLEQYGAEKNRLDEESISLQFQINEIKNIRQNSEIENENKNKFLTILKHFKKSFDELNSAKQKEMMYSLIDSIVVNGSSIKINFRL